MTYQYTNQSHLNPEQDPSQVRSTAHEILFGRAGVLSQANRSRAASMRIAMSQVETRPVQQDAMVPPSPAPETVQPAASEAPVLTLHTNPETQRQRIIRQWRDKANEEAVDSFDPGNIMGYEDLPA